jgi:peptidoglycan/xylan/chitin deacetylase (PgdA/CDA1 family)
MATLKLDNLPDELMTQIRQLAQHNNQPIDMIFSAKSLVSKIALLFPDAVFFKETSERVIALTIDDVPLTNDFDNKFTYLILEAIANHNRTIFDEKKHVHGTFFVITGHLGDQNPIIEHIVEQGHEIGNHGVFDETQANLSPDGFKQQFITAHKRLTQNKNLTIKWYRPGRGRYNSTMVQTLKKMSGYIPQFALASMIPLDTYELTNNPKFTAFYVSKFIFPGAILVLHGCSEQTAKNTAVALRQILSDLNQENYRVVSLTELWKNY